MGGRQLLRAFAFFEPPFDGGHVNAGLLRLAFELLKTNPREGDVIHFRRGSYTALVFDMAGGAGGDIGVKGSWLALKDRLVVGMTHDAVLSLDAFQRRVARSTVIFQRCVGLRQFTRTNQVLPKGQREHLTLRYIAMM